MAAETSRRRSGRTRTTNPRYVDNITNLDLGSSESEKALSVPDVDDSDDVDFAEAAVDEVEEEGAETDDDGDDVEVESDGDPVSIEDVREDVVAEQPSTQPKGPKGRKQRASQGAKDNPPRSSTRIRRGLRDLPRSRVRRKRIENTFGQADELIPYIKNRDIWQKDLTLPSHFAPSFYHTEAMREKEATEGWKWYVSAGGKDAFKRYQVTQRIKVEDAQEYLRMPSTSEQVVSMGPLNGQEIAKINAGSSILLGGAWPNATKTAGHVLNIGAQVQSMDWLPNNNSDEQYLAISTLHREAPSGNEPPNENPKGSLPPAFTAAPRHPTSIQIWRVTEDIARLNTIICLNFGDLKQLRWCPAPRPSEQSGLSGLLAGVFFDGGVRVLDISLQVSPSPEFIRITTVAFECILPLGVLPTSITWLSTQSLAVGCSNGYVAVFNLASHLNSNATSAPRQPRPWLYHPVHSTYILSIASCYPSRPNLLLTSSFDGSIRLTDVRNPSSDTISSPRSRVGTAALAWHDRLQSAVSVDELGTVEANTLRRFFRTIELGKLTAQAGDVRTSPVHGAILTGGLDGRAYVSGPMRKVSNAAKQDVWRQCWFEYTWRRGLDERQVEAVKADRRAAAAAAAGAAPNGREEADEHGDRMMIDRGADEDDSDGGEDLARLRQPMSRFLDGYKPEQVMGRGMDTHKLSLTYHTIYEEQTAIMQVAWNPNVRYGGWAAAGMGSGLVRIEDLTLKRSEQNQPKSRAGK